MSVIDDPRLANSGQHLVWLAGLREWALWSTPRPFKIYALAVNAAAVVVVVATATVVPVTGRDLALFVCLGGCSVLHMEATKRVEQLRELATEGRAYTNLKSVWSFAGLLLLPPPLVAALIMLTYVHMRGRLGRRIPPHRWMFGACNAIVATAAAGVILALASPNGYPGLPHGAVGVGVVVAAAVTRWAVNSVLMGGFLILQARAVPVRDAFRLGGDDFVEAGSLGLGLLAAFLIVHDPAYLLVLAIPLLVVHRGLLLPQLEYAAQRDRDTGLYTSGLWHELARKQIQRAEQEGKTAGVLLVCINQYGALTNLYGNAAGVRVLRSVVEAIRSTVRSNDLMARQSEKEVVILLADITPLELAEFAERLQGAINQLTVELDGPDGVQIPNLHVSIGGGLYPHHGGTLAEVMMFADNTAFSAHGADFSRIVRGASKAIRHTRN